MMSNSVVHHFNLFSLRAWAKIHKCYLCEMLWEKLDRRYGHDLQAENYQQFRTEVCWEGYVELQNPIKLYFALTNPSAPRDQWNFTHFFRMEAWPLVEQPLAFRGRNATSCPFTQECLEQQTSVVLQTKSRSTSWPRSRKEVSMENFRRGITTTESSRSRWLAFSWLSKCKTNEDGKHHECNKRDANYIPTRLLDVRHAQEASYLRLVCPADSPEIFEEDNEWMTLSHCWGTWGAVHNPILTENNLQQRKETGLRMADLPKTFRDAVKIATWFDSKCCQLRAQAAQHIWFKLTKDEFIGFGLTVSALCKTRLVTGSTRLR